VHELSPFVGFSSVQSYGCGGGNQCEEQIRLPNLRDARHRVLFDALQRLDSTTKDCRPAKPPQCRAASQYVLWLRLTPSVAGAGNVSTGNEIRHRRTCINPHDPPQAPELQLKLSHLYAPSMVGTYATSPRAAPRQTPKPRSRYVGNTTTQKHLQQIDQ